MDEKKADKKPPHFHEHRQRMKEKFKKSGLESFHDYEALELLLTYAIPRRDVKPLAKALIDKYGGFQAVMDAPVEALTVFPGLGEHSAILIKVAKECSDLYLKRRVVKKPRVCCAPDLINYCRMSMAGLKDEQFRVVFLNTQNEIIEIETIQEGTIDQSVVYPRKVMERALHYKAAALIFVHNHPGGKVKPSYADKEITNSLVTAAKSMDIEVHDHIIIGKEGYYSFRDSGLI
ncbi:MAG TPA: DNA repair protein RadC [Nitrospirota bacterium]|nr:DNA repair protein RadC [Nitrospirota bacterium]